MKHVDPPDLTLWPTIRHLYPLWRAQWRLAAIGLSCALVFTALSLLIPILVQRTIDNAIDGGDARCSSRTSRPSSPSRTLRFGINFTRRYATARIGVTVEARLRVEALRRVPPLPARVLRPARDGRGHLTGDERHLPRALLHRLGRRPGDPEHPHAGRRRDRPRRRSTAARADRARACRRSRSSPTSSRTACSRSPGRSSGRRAT